MDEPLYRPDQLKVIFDQLIKTVSQDFLFVDKVGSNDGILIPATKPDTPGLDRLRVPQRIAKGSRRAAAGRPLLNQALEAPAFRRPAAASAAPEPPATASGRATTQPPAPTRAASAVTYSQVVEERERGGGGG